MNNTTIVVDTPIYSSDSYSSAPYNYLYLELFYVDTSQLKVKNNYLIGNIQSYGSSDYASASIVNNQIILKSHITYEYDINLTPYKYVNATDNYNIVAVSTNGVFGVLGYVNN